MTSVFEENKETLKNILGLDDSELEYIKGLLEESYKRGNRADVTYDTVWWCYDFARRWQDGYYGIRPMREILKDEGKALKENKKED